MLEVSIELSQSLIRVLSADLERMASDISFAVAAEAQNKIAPYPPASEANNPANRRWYVRGTGGFYRRVDGSIVQTSSSETLGRHWSLHRRQSSTEVRNNARYVRYVHDKNFQAKFHARRGWKTNDGVVEQMQRDGTIERIGKQRVRHYLGLNS